MGADSFQIDQLNHLVKGITQQVQLALTAKLVDQRTGRLFSPIAGCSATSMTASSTSDAMLSCSFLYASSGK